MLLSGLSLGSGRTFVTEACLLERLSPLGWDLAKLRRFYTALGCTSMKTPSGVRIIWLEAFVLLFSISLSPGRLNFLCSGDARLRTKGATPAWTTRLHLADIQAHWRSTLGLTLLAQKLALENDTSLLRTRDALSRAADRIALALARLTQESLATIQKRGEALHDNTLDTADLILPLSTRPQVPDSASLSAEFARLIARPDLPEDHPLSTTHRPASTSSRDTPRKRRPRRPRKTTERRGFFEKAPQRHPDRRKNRA